MDKLMKQKNMNKINKSLTWGMFIDEIN